MPNLSEIFNAGAANAWIFVPSAIALGALHGLEPGHSKTMMAAFIVAIRGTAAQAVLLGLAATFSHTAIVWAIALTGLYIGSQFNAESNEPYLQMASGVLILTVAAWMAWRTLGAAAALRSARQPDVQAWTAAHHRDRGPAHDHRHAEDQVHSHAELHDAGVPHGHEEEEFEADLMELDPTAFADAHERAHALDIERRFAHKRVTTGQIILFGLTGGLIPCPASITVLLLCLQVGRFGLGAALVLCFSVGLALTLVLVGVAAALGLRHAASRWPMIESLAARAPYLSSAIVAAIGLYTIATAAAAVVA